MPLDSLDTLPFAGISDDEFMFIQSDYECCEQVFDQFDQLNFCTFQYSDYRAHDQESSIDPENNFYNYISSNCKYYSAKYLTAIICICYILLCFCHIYYIVWKHGEIRILQSCIV